MLKFVDAIKQNGNKKLRRKNNFSTVNLLNNDLKTN